MKITKVEKIEYYIVQTGAKTDNLYRRPVNGSVIDWERKIVGCASGMNALVLFITATMMANGDVFGWFMTIMELQRHAYNR